MKKLCFFISIVAIVSLFSCSKGSNPPTPTVDSVKIVHNKVKGDWVYFKLEEKYLEKSTGGVILNPDGTPKDTVRKTYNLTDSYFKFSETTVSMYENRNNNGFGYTDKAYEVIANGKRIQRIGIDPYDILALDDKNLVLKLKSVALGANGHYTEYYYTYHLKK